MKNNTNLYLFAWSSYLGTDHKATYFAVKSDYTIYISTNWEQFYKETNCYCEHSKTIFCDGFLTKNEDIELFVHKSFSKVFYTENNKLHIVSENEITYYEKERDTEAEYFSAVTIFNERNAN